MLNYRTYYCNFIDSFLLLLSLIRLCQCTVILKEINAIYIVFDTVEITVN